jgi:hypothetical protein
LRLRHPPIRLARPIEMRMPTNGRLRVWRRYSNN